MNRPKILMSTPTELSDRTMAAMARQVMARTDPELLALYRQTTDKLQQIMHTRNDVVLLHGEAILGLEAALFCLMEEGDKCLVLISGSFGDGFLDWVQMYGGVPLPLKVPYNAAIDPADVEQALRQHPDTKLLFVVFCETLSGTLNPAGEICSLASRFGVVSVVDAVTAVGSVEARVDDWHMDVCCAGSQKCFNAPPGLSLLSVSDAAWERMRKKKSPVRWSYLSLLDWKESWLEKGVFPYTPSMTDVYGLSAALDQVLEEGLDEVLARHGHAARVCRAGMRGMGLALWPVSDAIAAASATVARVPEGIDGPSLLRRMEEGYGVIAQAGPRSLRDQQLIGLSHMGRSADPMRIIVGLAALEKSLVDLGYPLKLGSGVGSALEAM
jgi:pyridoxamine--pyruvate transaminase